MRSPVQIALRLLGSILGMGAVACDGGHSSPLYGAPTYGAPYAEYKLSGKVVDAGTSSGIPGIALTFQGSTVSSGPDGAWAMDITTLPCESACALSAKDTDGPSHGSYTDLDVALTPTQSSPGNGAWNQGVFEQENIQVSLVPKP